MRSMTGFGAAALQRGGVALRAEVRTVNHKHLQVKLRLPAEWLHLEGDVEELVKQRLERGSVALNVHVAADARRAPARVDAKVAADLARELGALGRKLGLSGELSLDALARLPGVVVAGVEAAHEVDDKALLATVAKALTALEEMREAEGKALAKDLTRHLKQLAKLADGVGKRMPLVVVGHHAALRRRVDELLEGRKPLEPSELAREVALLADKLDVSEELSRLKSHFTQFETILARTGAVGRPLEFLVQELLRETNTIGSKCTDAAVAHAVVDMKAVIERLREQVQNVE